MLWKLMEVWEIHALPLDTPFGLWVRRRWGHPSLAWVEHQDLRFMARFHIRGDSEHPRAAMLSPHQHLSAPMLRFVASHHPTVPFLIGHMTLHWQRCLSVAEFAHWQEGAVRNAHPPVRLGGYNKVAQLTMR